SAAWMQRILTEIQGFMFRKAGVPVAPPLGRVALSAFSSGNGLAAQFLANPDNQRHAFYGDTLRELYMLDAPAREVSGWVWQAMRWARAGSASDKMIRIISRANHGAFGTLLGSAPPPSGPFVMDSPAGGLRTVAVLPEHAWTRATAARGAPGLVKSWQ